MPSSSRSSTWSLLDRKWDLVIIGGGITGAGILREAARAGLTALLLEAHDFASGTSSRSSKLVHGGFRYLRNAQFKVTLESVTERQRLLEEGRGLVEHLDFLLTSMSSDDVPHLVYGIGLAIYDVMARQWDHKYFKAAGLRRLCPLLTTPHLRGGYLYSDAETDDARLVLRVIQEARRDGGFALNYAPVTGLLKTPDGRVCGVIVEDRSHAGEGGSVEVQAGLVVNATGAWADEMRSQIGARPRLRPLRGSHLVFPAERLPLEKAITIWHPQDGRAVFTFPWEGATIIGTTDVDHGHLLQSDPAISAGELEYLLEAVTHTFPRQEITQGDVIATFSGVRPVVDTGKANPSKESREHVIWMEDGLLTITGGKLTTFRIMAHDALRAALPFLPDQPDLDARRPILDPLPALTSSLPPAQALRLLGRYGADAPSLLNAAQPDELSPIPGTPYLWAELRWAARAEDVIHLDDLLLRRLRLGLLAPEGGASLMPQIRAIAQPELGWDDARWEDEAAVYTKLWSRAYSLPSG